MTVKLQLGLLGTTTMLMYETIRIMNMCQLAMLL